MDEMEYKTRGDWNILKGQIKQGFGTLDDNDLEYADGKQDEWLGRLQHKVGRSKEELKRFIDAL